jgi:leader peptidase (prepilin peptidase) / N-methyltransferase
MPIVGVLLAGLLGLAVGSFLNVCIYRLPLRQSLAFPASHCMACNRRLSWFENIPVVAWLALGGRCRTCRTTIAVVYPAVEAFTGIMFAWAAWHYGPGWLLISRLLLGCMLIVLFFIDLQHQILPNGITLPGAAAGFILSFVTPPGWVDSLIGLLTGGLILYAVAELYVRFRRTEGLGMGDVKMLALIGAFLGWKLMLLTLTAASVLGAAVGLGLIVSGSGGMKSKLPFGTFLAVAAMFAAAVGDPIVKWYLGFYR